MARVLEGVRLLKRKDKHDSGWSYFDRLAVSCPNPEHVRCSRSRSVVLQMDVVGRNAPPFFLGVWLQAAWLTEVEHRAYMLDIGSMRLYQDAAGFFHRHFLWSLGNSALEGKPICVRVSLLLQFARLQMLWSGVGREVKE